MEGSDRLGDAALWRGVVDASPDAVLLVDDAGLVVSANSHCLEVFGTPPDDLVATLGLTGRRIAIEVNEAIVPRSQHTATRLADGDRVEVVHAIGGG